MGLNLGGIFKSGAEGLLKGASDIVDKFIQTPDEKAAINLELGKLANAHLEAMQALATKEIELEYQDRASARTRESEFIKATGHMDFMLWFLAISAMVIFTFMVYSVIKGTVPTENRELIFHIFGIVEGFILSIFTYYFGSSAGSRAKDMKPK